MIDYQFKQNFQVRDYECDQQGIVNNAVYLHYLEHTRHQLLKTAAIDFVDLVEKGINLVVIRVEINYLSSLRSGDLFTVGLNCERVSHMRFGFLQDIIRLSDNKLVANAKVICTTVNETGKPILPKGLDDLLDGIFLYAGSFNSS